MSKSRHLLTLLLLAGFVVAPIPAVAAEADDANCGPVARKGVQAGKNKDCAARKNASSVNYAAAENNRKMEKVEAACRQMQLGPTLSDFARQMEIRQCILRARCDLAERNPAECMSQEQ